jgi:hypothetical protein
MPRTPLSTASLSCHFDGLSGAIGMPTRGGKPPMSARRVELVHGGSGRGEREARLETQVLGELLRTQQLQQPEKPVGVVFERGRAEQQHVTPSPAIGAIARQPGVAGVARTAAEPLGFVHDEEIDARSHRLAGQLRPFDEHLQRDHRADVGVERVEVGAEVARHVGEALRIEEREHLVIFPPELTEPLTVSVSGATTRQRFDLPCVHQPIQDERGLDGLSEADFVGEQPTHGIAGARALRDVELVGKEPDASAEEGAQAVGFAKGQRGAGCPGGSRNPRRRRDRPRRVRSRSAPSSSTGHSAVRRRRAPVRKSPRPVLELRDDRRFLTSLGDPDRACPG